LKDEKDINIDIPWLYSDVISISGKTLPIQYFREYTYQSQYGTYKSEYFLIGEDIFLIYSTGIADVDVFTNAFQNLEYLLNEIGRETLFIIWDISEVSGITVKVRQSFKNISKKIKRFFVKRYICTSEDDDAVFRLFNYFHEDEDEKVIIVDNVRSALKEIVSGEKVTRELSVKNEAEEQEQLQNLSKDELIDQITSERKHFRKQSDVLMKAFSEVSWGKHFNPVELDTDIEDPFKMLFDGVTQVHRDIYFIINELIELNQNLEYKVAERIVDIIDKESNLRSILDNSDSLIWLINSRMELIDFNVAFTDAMKLHYNTSPKVHQHILDVISLEDDREMWRERYESVLNGEAGVYIETEINPLKDDEQVFEIRTFPIREVGKIKGVAVFQKDITELKKKELTLLEKNKDLEKVNRELDSFVYRVSHDLRAPLISILGLINVMRIEEDKDKLKEFIEYQEQSVKKLDKFIFDIINLSRNSRQELNISEIDFNHLLKRILDSQAFAVGSENVDKKIEINNIVPFYSDFARLNVVLNNLISNSIKYRDRRKENQFVRVQVDANNDECRLIISDNGIGIDKKYLDKIFNMFFRAHNEVTGSGIGLYIVKETVEKLFGNIQVSSKPTQGTTFTIVLPNLKEQMKLSI
jgi:PAS domain S-box-containing protein